jgi:hypothetical protein
LRCLSLAYRSAHSCGIYEKRPRSCRVFRCAWLTTPNWPEHLRPDRTRVVPWFTTDGQSLALYCDPGHPTAWRNPELLPIIDAVLKDRRHVLVVVGDRSAPLKRGPAGLERGAETALSFDPQSIWPRKISDCLGT